MPLRLNLKTSDELKSAGVRTGWTHHHHRHPAEQRAIHLVLPLVLAMVLCMFSCANARNNTALTNCHGKEMRSSEAGSGGAKREVTMHFVLFAQRS